VTDGAIPSTSATLSAKQFEDARQHCQGSVRSACNNLCRFPEAAPADAMHLGSGDDICCGAVVTGEVVLQDGDGLIGDSAQGRR
jgi:hypothetical protein